MPELTDAPVPNFGSLSGRDKSGGRRVRKGGREKGNNRYSSGGGSGFNRQRGGAAGRDNDFDGGPRSRKRNFQPHSKKKNNKAICTCS